MTRKRHITNEILTPVIPMAKMDVCVIDTYAQRIDIGDIIHFFAKGIAHLTADTCCFLNGQNGYFLVAAQNIRLAPLSTGKSFIVKQTNVKKSFFH